MQEIYMAMQIKTYLNNAPKQITVVCFEHEHELVIAVAKLILNYMAIATCTVVAHSTSVSFMDVNY